LISSCSTELCTAKPCGGVVGVGVTVGVAENVELAVAVTAGVLVIVAVGGGRVVVADGGTCVAVSVGCGRVGSGIGDDVAVVDAVGRAIVEVRVAVCAAVLVGRGLDVALGAAPPWPAFPLSPSPHPMNTVAIASATPR
jgi:hypothetical protein